MNLDQDILPKPATYSSLDRKIQTLVAGVSIVVALALVAMPYFSGGTDVKAILGQWTTAENGWRMTFHADKSVDIGSGVLPSNAPGAAPGSSSLVEGWFVPNIDGMVEVKMKDGKAYTAFFREVTPDQFDLTDRETGHVIVFKRAP